MTYPAPDREYISQNIQHVLGLEIRVSGELADPDGNAVSVRIVDESTAAVIVNRAAQRVAIGKYQIELTSAETSQAGDFTVTWSFTQGGQPNQYPTYISIQGSGEPYDSLSDGMKAIVEQAWVRIADLFDSPYGGPHLQTYYQSHFNRGRIAQLLYVAVGILNTAAQPHQTYTIDGDGGATFPIEQWGSLLSQALWVEVIKHLRRSYIEQPRVENNSVTRLDRTSYSQMWAELLKEEQATLKSQLDPFKIAAMNLGRPSVLVSGGVFGRYGPTRTATMAARPRYWARFYG